MGDVLSSPEKAYWLAAISEEHDMMTQNDTWLFKQKSPTGTRIMHSGIVLKLERKATG